MTNPLTNGPPRGADPAATRTSLGGVGPSVGTLLAGRYSLLELLGIGGMGMVYRARDEELGIEVAVKVLRTEMAPSPRLDELRDRLRGELLLGRKVTHRHVVRIHDLGQDGDLFFLTMDFIAGRSLESILRSQGHLEVERSVAIARQIADGLSAAHREGIVHRDLKPANVLLDAEDRAYLTDFGVATSLQSAGMTVAGGVVGTPDYLSPEQARGEGVDGRSDLYALGILLFEMLSGELPFGGATWNERLARRVSGAPARDLATLAPATPRHLRGIIQRCLERRPADRYPDAAAFLADLEAGRDPQRRRRAVRVGAWTAAGLTAALLAVYGVAAWRSRPVPTPPSQTTAVPAAHAVVVLPVDDETGRPALSWSSRGLAEIAAAALAESPRLRVIDPPRLRRLLADLNLTQGELAPADLARVAQLLGADRVVSGTLRAAGERLRLELALVEPERGQLLERQEAEGGEAELFSLTERLALDLRAFLVPATPGETREDAVALSRSPVAIAAYAAGQEALARGDPRAALPELERATQDDPRFALAWVRLSEAYQALGYATRAREAAARAVVAAGPGSGRAGLEARAREASLAGDPAAARQLFEQLLARYPNDVEARLAYAEVCRQAGDLEVASAAALEVVRLDPQHPRAWYQLGKYEIMSGKSRDALAETLVRALVVQNRLGSEQGRADVVNAMGVAHQELGEMERAAERYREAIELRRAVDDRRGVAASLKNLAMVELVAGRTSVAAKLLAEALANAQAVGDPATTADVENALGGLEEERGRYGEALPHFRRALQLRRELGDDVLVGASLDSVGFCYYLLGEFDDAMTYWQQSLELSRSAGDRVGVVYARQNVAQLDLARGQWDRALRAFVETLEESRALELPDGEAVAAGGIGRVALLQGRSAAALDSFRTASAKLAEMGDVRGEMEFGLAEVEAQLALDHGAEAMARLAEIGAKQGTLEEEASSQIGAERERLHAELAARAGRVEESRAAAARALELAKASGSVLVTMRAAVAAAAAEPPRRRGAALEGAMREARRLGHAAIELDAAERLAEFLVESGDRGRGERTLREALDLAARCGTYGRSPLLRERLAVLLEATGRTDEGAQQRQRAAEERRRMGVAARAEPVAA